ncbi:DUF3604 domain-containing protein [Pseudooceanicola sp. C21-150M6]|uniref:DUF3604 domain-containing protein n=1 Tax=Pseudooceanicola sp. C21-150M6 TaxID=3434355 RepID=UPI003D7FFF82
MSLPRYPAAADLVGDASFSTRPGDDANLYGTATMQGPATAEVRTYQTFRVTYTTGKLGLDDTGSIRIAFRFISDAGLLQTSDPTAPNYVTARSSGEGQLQIKYDRNGGQRPWNETLTIYQSGGYLKPGETIEVVIGDTSGGSPGMLMPTFLDSGRVFRVMSDIQATGVHIPVPGDPLFVTVVPGPAHRHLAVLPTLRRPGQPFHLGIKAEDLWGNPTGQGPRQFRVDSSLPVTGLPEVIDFAPDSGAMTLEGLSCETEGELRITLTDDRGQIVRAGPMTVADRPEVHFWGDLHGQTGETVGTNTAEYYFDFARTKSFLDVTSHQGNDFQITDRFWRHLNDITAAANEPGRFTVLPGYEWSGNTAVGGDHNVFYATEGAPIYRCSHALVADRSDMDTDAHTLTDLYAKFEQEPVDKVMYAHVGGRYANIFYDHDPRYEAAVEMHSAWGSFEWILTDGFPLRRRVGVVCNSDGHKGRPGASYPGASVFGAYGGLTCFIMSENTRETVFEAIRRRHTYGTTGPRVFAEVTVRLPEGGTLFHRNPDAFPDTATEAVDQCIMGDIVRVNGDSAEISVTVKAPTGIVSLELRDGTEVIRRLRPYAAADLGQRIRVMWSGAEYRGRGRNTTWRGRADFFGTRIEEFTRINRLNHEQLLDQTGSSAVVWSTVTTGNMMGFDARIGPEPEARLQIATSLGNLDLAVSDIGLEPSVMPAGGLARELRVQRLPDGPLPASVTLQERVPLRETGDTPLWICATLEDGNQVWSSPIYLFRD